MITMIACGVVLGIGTSACGYSVVDTDNLGKLMVA